MYGVLNPLYIGREDWFKTAQGLYAVKPNNTHYKY